MSEKNVNQRRPGGVRRHRLLRGTLALGLAAIVVGGSLAPAVAMEPVEPFESLVGEETVERTEVVPEPADQVTQDVIKPEAPEAEPVLEEQASSVSADSDVDVSETVINERPSTEQATLESAESGVTAEELPDPNAGVVPSPKVSIAPRMAATGGFGRYGDVIDWAEWGTVNRKIDETSDVMWTTPTAAGDNSWMSTRCEISDVIDKTPAYPIGFPDFKGEGVGGSNPQRPAALIKAYRSGAWSGDALDDMYNVGGTGAANQLVNAIAVEEFSVPGLRRYDTTVEFRFDCRSWLVPGADKPQPSTNPEALGFTEIPLAGLVFADAESNNWYPDEAPFHGSQREYISVAPNPTGDQEPTWRLLDSYRTPGCTTNSVAEFIGGGEQLKFRSDHIQCATAPGAVTGQSQGPASVMFLEGSNSATVEIRGGGQGAVALGALIAVDYGDAPSSYGSAAALFQPTWQGGALNGTGSGVDGTHNLTAMKAAGQLATTGTPDTILGQTIDGELAAQISSDAGGDDRLGVDDEDGVTFEVVDGVRNQIHPKLVGDRYQFAQDVVCVGPGEVAAWIDWNRDGVFDAAEKSTQVECVAGSVTLDWDVPEALVERSVAGEAGSAASFMRVRITSQANNGSVISIPPTGLTTVSGEVEDYMVEVLPMRKVPIVVQKMIVPIDAPAGSIEGAVPAGDDWEFSLPQELEWAPAEGVEIALESSMTNADGQVHGEVRFPGTMDVADIALVETQQSGFEVVPVNGKHAVCVNTLDESAIAVGAFLGSAEFPGFSTGVQVGQEIQCTIYNKPNVYELSWAKVAAGATDQLLADSEWTLTPYLADGTLDLSQTIEIEDCVATEVAECTGADKDPAAGKFLITGLVDGTYSLEETKAPAGYQLLDAPVDVVVNSNTTLGNIENIQSAIPELPLTGGVGTFGIFLATGGLGALVLLALVYQRRRMGLAMS